MLAELSVRDLALVDAARLAFGPGLNLLTGETGSGKSLVVDALALALGARASTDQVRHGAERALVEAVFTTPDGRLCLSREVGRRGQARIDGRPATPSQLREAGARLVGMHSQHEAHGLTDPEAQTELLDGFGGLLGQRGRVGELHAADLEARRLLEALEQVRDRGERDREYLAWQLEELRAAGLRVGEDAELAAERSVARHAARLASLTGEALEALRGDEGIAAATSRTRAAAELDPRLAGAADRLASLEEEVAGAVAELREYAEALDADPRRLEVVEDRLALLDGIKRRFGGSIEAAIETRERLEAQVGGGQDLEGRLAAAREAAAAARAGLEAAAAELSRGRAEAAARLAAEVEAELQGLRLEGARLEVRLAARPELSAAGAEVADIHFSANPGEPPAPLARVASGGELARVMLAVKTVTAASEALPTLVFDEVDAGIGGEAALQVGLRLRTLGDRHQVLVVTHLPQIACFADHHLVVEKVPGAGGRNVVRVRELTGDGERAAELARMMGGRVTEKALERARELIEEARR